MSVDNQILVVAVLLGLIPAFIARRKGHTFFGFWLMGAMFFIVALPWAIFIKRNRRDQRQCPACREWVDSQATACSHCTRDLPAVAAQPTQSGTQGSGEAPLLYGVGAFVVLCLGAIGWLLH